MVSKDLEWATTSNSSFIYVSLDGNTGIIYSTAHHAYPSCSHISDLTYINIDTTSNSVDFGNLTDNISLNACCASQTRFVSSNGVLPTIPEATLIDGMYYVHFSSKGNMSLFGSSTCDRYSPCGCSSSTRGIFSGGRGIDNVSTNAIDYITIANVGNATLFGNLTVYRTYSASCSSPTIGVICGGGIFTGGGGSWSNIIDYVTISTTGNATDFGDLTQTMIESGSSSTSTTGFIGGGKSDSSGSPTRINTIEKLTFASIGNASNFGSLSSYRNLLGACSSSTKCVFVGGMIDDDIHVVTNCNTSNAMRAMDYIYTATGGAASDFGDCLLGFNGASNCHGGLA
jgi:hypothetical protein